MTSFQISLGPKSDFITIIWAAVISYSHRAVLRKLCPSLCCTSRLLFSFYTHTLADTYTSLCESEVRAPVQTLDLVSLRQRSVMSNSAFTLKFQQEILFLVSYSVQWCLYAGEEGELSSQNYNRQFIIFLLSDKDIQHLTLFSCLHLICMLTSAEWLDSRSSVWVCSARSDGLKHLQLFWGILGAQIQPRLLYLLIICFMCSQLIF